jgi:glycosyltransferase involved in cell wall biosynthesis
MERRDVHSRGRSPGLIDFSHSMHIAHFTNAYHPVVNGVVRSVSSFRKAQQELGHNPFVFAQYAGKYEDQDPFVFRYPAFKLPGKVDFPWTVPVSPFVDWLLPSLQPDVLHTHHPFLLGRAAVAKSKELDLPLVYTFHTQYSEYTHYFPVPVETIQDLIKDAIENWLGEFMGRCHHIIVPTESMKDIVVEAFGLEGGVTAIPTGIDLAPFERADGAAVRAREGWGDDTVMLSIGRLAPEKNFETLIDATALALQEHPQLRLVLIGDGPSKSNLRQQTEKLGIAERVTFTGKVPFEEIPAYLKATNLFGFASTTETQGLVTMEAMAAGLPVVAVAATGTEDVLDHEVQGLMTENNPVSLATGIVQVLESPENAQNFSREALRTARSLEISTQAERMVAVYEQAIEAKRASKKVQVTQRKKLFRLRDSNLEFRHLSLAHAGRRVRRQIQVGTARLTEHAERLLTDRR